jgi:hypothetical protein
VRAVKFNVHYLNRERVSPGYWFVAPYLHIDPDAPTSLYEQYQIGPHIYDGEGVRVLQPRETNLTADHAE